MCDSIFKIILLLAFVPLSARTPEEHIDQLQTQMSQVRCETVYGNFGARTPSGNLQIDGYGFFVSADFLWWKLYEGGSDYVFVDKDPGPYIKGPIKHLSFAWEPGFKVGLGYLFEHDGWDCQIEGTVFQTHAHNSEKREIISLFPLIGIQGIPGSKVTAHWHVHFYNVDLLLGRDTFVSKFLALHPYFGLANGWIQQHRKLRVFPETFALKSKSTFWGIGPKLGIDAQFFFNNHFSLCGNFFGDLLWGNFHITENEKTVATGLELYDLHFDMHRMVPVIGFELGAMYGIGLNKDRYYLQTKLVYESQYWFRQNQFPIFDLTSLKFTRSSEDLSMQGLTLELRFDF